MRVSEHVTIEEINKWEPGSIITIKAGTGAGKSYFIKNNLYAIAKRDNKKILMLIHRTNCINQFRQEIRRDNKSDVIHIKSYQSLEKSYLQQREIDFSEYQYIVCDEFHYFMSDALFNKFTDISLNAILDESNATRIFMSATGDNMTNFLTKYKKYNVIPYSIPTSYNFIKSLSFYNKDESIEKFMEQAIQNNMKSIFFIQSVEKAYKLYKKYQQHCLFNCSTSNQKYKYVDKDKINNMLVNERFEELILITTTALDTGVNLIDEDLKYIVTDVKDVDTLIQCIGRKRIINKNDQIELYIKSISNKQLGGMSSQAKRKLERARFLRNHTTNEYNNKYPRDSDKWNIVYNENVPGSNDMSTLKVNELVYFKCLIDCAQIDCMLNEKYGYNKHLARIFGFYDPDEGYQYKIIEEDYNKMELEKYLESLIGKKLFKDEQQELKEMFKENGLNAKTLGINTLNGNLKDRSLPFVIEQGKRKSFRDDEGKIKKEASHWIIGKITF